MHEWFVGVEVVGRGRQVDERAHAGVDKDVAEKAAGHGLVGSYTSGQAEALQGAIRWRFTTIRNWTGADAPVIERLPLRTLRSGRRVGRLRGRPCLGGRSDSRTTWPTAPLLTVGRSAAATSRRRSRSRTSTSTAGRTRRPRSCLDDYLKATAMVGDEGYVRERIQAFKAAGVTRLSVNPVGEDR